MSALTDWLSTLANLGTAGIAIYATANWRRAPARQRRDDCTSAIHMCASFIGRAVSFKAGDVGPDRVWRAHDDARDAWRQFRQAYAVARTYQPAMTEAVIAEGPEILDRLTALCRGEHFDDGRVLNRRFGQLVAAVETELKAIL